MCINCRSGGMVYTCDSKSHGESLVGSSPTFGTIKNNEVHAKRGLIYFIAEERKNKQKK